MQDLRQFQMQPYSGKRWPESADRQPERLQKLLTTLPAEAYRTIALILASAQTRYFTYQRENVQTMVAVRLENGTLSAAAACSVFGLKSSADLVLPVHIKSIDKRFNAALVLYAMHRSREFLEDVRPDVVGGCLCTRRVLCSQLVEGTEQVRAAKMFIERFAQSYKTKQKTQTVVMSQRGEAGIHSRLDQTGSEFLQKLSERVQRIEIGQGLLRRPTQVDARICEVLEHQVQIVQAVNLSDPGAYRVHLYFDCLNEEEIAETFRDTQAACVLAVYKSTQQSMSDSMTRPITVGENGVRLAVYYRDLAERHLGQQLEIDFKTGVDSDDFFYKFVLVKLIDLCVAAEESEQARSRVQAVMERAIAEGIGAVREGREGIVEM